MKQTILIASIAFASVMTGCTDNDYQPAQEADVAVVEAYLEPGHEINVYLSKMVPYITESADSVQKPIESVDVYIKHNDMDFLLEPAEEDPGRYVCLDSGLVLVPGDEYELSFDYHDNTVSAMTTIPVKPAGTGLYPDVLQINPNDMRPGMMQNKVTVYWDNPDNGYFLIVTEYLDSAYTPINPYFDPEIFDDYRKVSTKPVADYSYDLDTRRQLLFFGRYRVIVYKVNEEYVNLYENISQSSLNLTEPLTNVENGLGIFTGVNSDTLLLEVQKIWW